MQVDAHVLCRSQVERLRSGVAHRLGAGRHAQWSRAQGIEQPPDAVLAHDDVRRRQRAVERTARRAVVVAEPVKTREPRDHVDEDPHEHRKREQRLAWCDLGGSRATRAGRALRRGGREEIGECHAVDDLGRDREVLPLDVDVPHARDVRMPVLREAARVANQRRHRIARERDAAVGRHERRRALRARIGAPREPMDHHQLVRLSDRGVRAWRAGA